MARVVLLTNMLPPYRLPLYEAIAAGVDSLEVVLSTPSEPNRDWPVEWGSLDVATQRCITIPRRWRHPQGFEETVYVHLPVDTIPRLWRSRPDCVISSEFGMRTLQAFLYCLVRPQTRLIIWANVSESTEHNRGKLRQGLRRFLAGKADAVLVNGESGKRYLRQFDIPEAKFFLAPYSTDAALFEDISIQRPSTQTRRLLSVGQLSARKGIADFCDVVREWAANNPNNKLELTLAGTGPDLDRISGTTNPPNLDLRILGHVEYQDLPELYSKNDIFVFPTLADEWGLVTNEAMAAGLPVLGSVLAQSVDELVDDGVTGWRFDPSDRIDAASALARALEATDEQLVAMRHAARQAALELSAPNVASNVVAAVSSE